MLTIVCDHTVILIHVFTLNVLFDHTNGRVLNQSLNVPTVVISTVNLFVRTCGLVGRALSTQGQKVWSSIPTDDHV